MGVSQLETRLFQIIYDDLTYMSGILANVEFSILAEVPEKLDLSYFLSLHLVLILPVFFWNVLTPNDICQLDHPLYFICI